MPHQHYIQRCCLEALLEDVKEEAATDPNYGKEKAEAVFELLLSHLAEVWEPIEPSEREGS